MRTMEAVKVCREMLSPSNASVKRGEAFWTALRSVLPCFFLQPCANGELERLYVYMG